MPSAHGGAGIEVILIKDNGKFIMALINTERLPVAVIIGATSKWQSDGRNTLLAHGHAVEDSTLPTSVRWGVGGAIAQKFAKEGYFTVVTTRRSSNAKALETAIVNEGGLCIIIELDLASEKSISASTRTLIESISSENKTTLNKKIITIY